MADLPTQLDDFKGHWRLVRRITDARGPDGAFAGQAVLSPIPTGLRYHETGQLTLGATQFTAERSYLWSAPAFDQIAIQFADQRPFHSFTLGPRPDARHDCPPDTYQVAYDFTAWPIWHCTWQVSGPRKAYVMTSRYVRAKMPVGLQPGA